MQSNESSVATGECDREAEPTGVALDRERRSLQMAAGSIVGLGLGGWDDGWQMNGRAKALPEDRALRDVVAYIDSLPKAHATPTLRGNATAGKAQYATCATCHGERGEGNAAAGAPALAGLDDWYVLAQLSAYRTGERGKHKDDTGGAQMRTASALALMFDAAVRDVAAYIASLH